MSNHPYAMALIGKRFGRLTVVERLGRNRANQALWKCKCDCGNEKIAASQVLRTGDTKSCGCQRRDYDRSLVKHGLSRTPEYNAWAKMIQRCGPSWKQSYDYFDRGITVHPEWVDRITGFPRFLQHVGHRPSPKHSIDRIDNDKGYIPGNLRWVTSNIQNNNRRNKRIEQFANDVICREHDKRFWDSNDPRLWEANYA